MAQLIVTLPSGKTATVPVRAPETSVGRGRSNDVVLESPLASRRHAVLLSDGPFVTIKDSGSLNGTFVNGIRISVQVLAHGDTIGIGDCMMRFLTTDQELVSAEALQQITARGLLS